MHLTDQLGLVLVDRNTVAIGAVNIQLDFGAYPCHTYGRVCFLHPLHNFALVAFLPQNLSAEVRGTGCDLVGRPHVYAQKCASRVCPKSACQVHQ